MVRKRPIEVDAYRWWRNGDHPDDGIDKAVEGLVVRYYRHPGVDGGLVHGEMADSRRLMCRATMDEHGWIDTLEGGHTVCPGDWIVTGVQGERYPVEPSVFDMSYEGVDEVDVDNYEEPTVDEGTYPALLPRAVALSGSLDITYSRSDGSYVTVSESMPEGEEPTIRVLNRLTQTVAGWIEDDSL